MAGSPAEVAAAVQVVVTMVVDGPQVERVLLGPRVVSRASGAQAHGELALLGVRTRSR
ncbi:hypothetical protein BH20ACT18_BH20ACT18_07250 [soil metagenome]